jgi:hypothetical protein
MVEAYRPVALILRISPMSPSGCQVISGKMLRFSATSQALCSIAVRAAEKSSLSQYS